jgi:hypothetical protein
MNSRRVLIFLLCLLSLTLASCGGKGSGGGSTRIRVLNAIPDATAISLTLDTNAPIVTGLQFQQMTQYIDVGSGSHEFKVSANGGASNVIDTTLSLASGADLTYVVYGPVSAAVGLIFGDTGFTSPNSGNFAIRAVNAAAGVGPIDVYLTAPGTDLNTTSATIPNVGFGNVSAFTNVLAGTYEIRVTAANTKDVIFDTGTTAFADQTMIDVVAITKGSAKLVNMALLPITNTGAGQVNENLLAEFKVINASSVASPLNVAVDGTLTLSNVPYTGVSNYTTVSAGSRTFTVQATATPGANLLTLVNSLASATDTSLVLSGPAGALAPLVLQDNNLPPPTGRARLRFVDTSADFPSLDVYVNFSKQVSSLTTNSASSYLEVTADATIGTSYEFDFNTAGTVTPVLKLIGVSIIAGHTYTVYVVGPAAAPVGVVTKDD